MKVGTNIVLEDDDVEILVEDGVAVVDTSVPDFATKLEGTKVRQSM